jgi:hypothetical protein
MSLFEQAACLNNEGVTALLEGDDTSAIDAMTKSIKMMKKELSKPGTELSAFKSDVSSDAADQLLDTVEIRGMAKLSTSHVKENKPTSTFMSTRQL